MLSASLYITVCTARNHTRRWLRRLKEPRYLAGLVIAAMYFYVTLFARTRGARGPRGGRPSLEAFPALAGLVPELAAIALLLAAAAVWLLPTSGRLLDFAPAEVQFLFPAPAPRRSLLIHRLLRSQTGLLFASLVPALVVSIPVGSATLAVRTALGIWILLVAARVYFSAIALARSRLSSPDFKLRRLARLPLVVVLAGVLIVGGALLREYMHQPFAGLDDATNRITAVLALGPQRLILWPFVRLVGPFFATGWGSYVAALLLSALVAVVAMVWLVASDDVFQGASAVLIEAKEGRPEGKASYAARRAIWTLAPTGRPEAAFIWKTTQQVFRVVDRRVLARVVLILVAMSILVVFSSRTGGLAGVGGVFSAFGAVYIVLLAPQILRLDMRQDLQHLELLKTWPVRGAAVVRGEMTGPALVLGAGAWLLIGLALLFSGTAFRGTPLAWRGAAAIAGAVLGPALIFGQYMIHNAMALLLPAWIPVGSGRPRGLDAMGQRFLLLGATWLALAIMLLPGAAVSALLWLAFYRVLGAGMLVVAAVLCAAAMAIEILMMSEALGPAYERLDLLAIERPD